MLNIGVKRNGGKRELTRAKNRLELAKEPFFSIQGEGIIVGEASIFIRLAGCNLKCSWCDTEYSLFDEVSKEELFGYFDGRWKTKSLVITGGEPLLQSRFLEKFIYEGKDKGLFNWVVIETNGTFFDSSLLPWVDFWSLSPKLKNSGNSKIERKLNDNWKLYMKEGLFSGQVKFVLTKKRDMEEVKNILEDIPSFISVVFQPEWSKGKSFCKDILSNWDFRNYPVRIIPQVHKFVGLK